MSAGRGATADGLISTADRYRGSYAVTPGVYKDERGNFLWPLRAKNSLGIAPSGDGYKEKRSCLAAIESVKRDAAAAQVHEID